MHRNSLRTLLKSESGLAAVEFAVGLPFFLGLTVASLETANYANTVMQLNQITIHTADTASRMGEADIIGQKEIREIHVNDVFAGMAKEGESLELLGNHAYTDPNTNSVTLRGNAMIYLSSIERVANAQWVASPTSSKRYRMRWQRCAGRGTFMQQVYGKPTTVTSVAAFSPDGKTIIPTDEGAIMFVEMHYWYKPVIVNGFAKLTDHKITTKASMVVRDQRIMRREATEESTPVQNQENVTVATCPTT
jgi:hypothetical protein